MKSTILLLLVLVILCCCQEQINPPNPIKQLGLETLPEISNPADNPFSSEKQLLGKYLFYDPILSGERDVACATCHLPDRGYADGIDLSIGVGGRGYSTDRQDFSSGRIPHMTRNSQSIINTAFNGLISSQQNLNPLQSPMFWDGRKTSLESQCLGPLAAYNIMRGDAYPATLAHDSVIARLKKITEYDALFTQAFGSANSITLSNLTKAIAAFERGLVSNNSPYDQYVKGSDDALSEMQKHGLQLFFGKGNCATCHSGPMFSDFNYYNIGIEDNSKNAEADRGKDSKFLFRTPSLRNVSLTAPYMHNGTLPTLETVLAHYIKGTTSNPDIIQADAKFQPLHLTSDDASAIISFLNALSDDSYDKEFPTRVPSGLKPGGN